VLADAVPPGPPPRVPKKGETAARELSRRLGRIGLHDHACLVLGPEDQRLEIASSFLHIGLERGERCVYVADETTAGRVMPLLRAEGADPGRALASGSLVITTDGGLSLRSGSLDPAEIFHSLEAQVEAAQREGFEALRVLCEATWVLGRNTRFDRLLDYEERLKRTFRDRKIVGLWQYDPWRCSAGVLRHLLRMHPLVVARGDVHRNCLFVPAARSDGRPRQEEWQAALDEVVERARSEEAAARRLQQLQLALEGGAHALWEWDLEGEAITLDPQLSEMLGFEPSRCAVTLSEWEQVLHVEDLGPFWKRARDHIEGRSSRLEHECRMQDRSGRWRWVHLRARSVERDPAGRLLRIAGTATEVTELRATRERLLAADQLDLSDRLASGAAREIEGPLAKVTTALGVMEELLQRLPAGDVPAAGALARITEVLGEAQRSADRVRDVVVDMALGSSANRNTVNCDVREELLRAVNMARLEVTSRARMSASLSEPLPRVLAPARALAKVFLSLLLDAARAIPEGAPEDNEVRLTARVQGESVIVEVTDTGVRRSAEAREGMQDPSFDLQDGEVPSLGVGDLLACVERCGGSIEIENEPGRGTTARVVLPSFLEPEARGEPRELATGDVRRRVLVIDGEELFAGSFARILRADHEVTVLSSAEEALRRAEAGESWDVILCDLRMGELDGMEFHERLGRTRPDLAARVGFITEGPWPPEVRTFLARNIWPTVEKPLDPEGVRAIVDRMAPQ
jgi:PAS domain S-box-containing protein